MHNEGDAVRLCLVNADVAIGWFMRIWRRSEREHHEGTRNARERALRDQGALATDREGPHLMPRNAYGFCAEDIHQLAVDLSQSLETRLYAQESPMIGPWYSSEDLVAVKEALTEGKGYVEPARCFQLLPNDSEPGMTDPAFPGGGNCQLLVWARAEEFDDIEQALRDSGWPFERLEGREARQ